jgi:Ca2+-binding EF-hand superfamily protein
MMSQVTAPINFTIFLSMFGEKLNGTDPDKVIINAFSILDPQNSGFVCEKMLINLLKTTGDRFSDDEIENLFQNDESLKLDNSSFNYHNFVRLIKNGQNEIVNNDIA